MQQQGITYNRFHVTAVCSPTRAALLTGRNHHRVGMGGIAEFPGPFPGYTGIRPQACTALPRILRENGYITGGFGKWHMTPGRDMGAAGSFDHWPTGWGFDHWWGFLTGAAGQYDPIITQDNSTLGVPEGDDGKLYYFPDDITDKTVEWLHAVRAQDADKPWFVYYSTGATHAPHHVAKEWADKYKGQFDDGWDVYRERTLERQKQLGIVPTDTELAPRPDAFPAWESLSEAERRLYARQMEVFAGFSENADWNVGRLLDSIEEMGELDNTLVIYIWGDNGASMEGTTTGSFNETTFFNGVVLDAEEQLALIDKYGGIAELGGFHTAPHFAAAWAHANNTPFQWGKQMASHLGGTRDPMVISWPAQDRRRRRPAHPVHPLHRRRARPSWRSSASPSPPSSTGSTRSRWTAPASRTPSTPPRRRSSTPCSTSRCTAAAPSTRTAGGPAPSSTSCPGTSRPRPSPGSGPAASGTRTTTCGSCTTCRTTSPRPTTSRPTTPTRSAELVELFWAEAERNRVLPLLGGFAAFFGILPPMPTQTRFTFAGDVQNIQTTMIPRIYGRSYAIEADVHVPEGGAEGVLVAFADFIGGFALWVDENGLLNHTYQFLGVDTYRQTSTEPIPTGDVTLTMLFEADEATPGTGGHVTLWADDRQIGEGDLPHTIALAVHHLRRHGHLARQRRRRRPRLRGPRSVRLHRHRAQGRLRPRATRPRRGGLAARGDRARRRRPRGRRLSRTLPVQRAAPEGVQPLPAPPRHPRRPGGSGPSERSGVHGGYTNRGREPMTTTKPRPVSRVQAGRTGFPSGGAEGIRTPDLLIANETRYQLRHSPAMREKR